jgi:ankyrin repeat protein
MSIWAFQLSKEAFDLCREQDALGLRAFFELHPDVSHYIFLHEELVSDSEVCSEPLYCNIAALAAHHRSPRCLQVLLDWGVDVSTQDQRFGWNAFMSASSTGSVECVRLLLQNNADMRLVDSEGRSGVIHAAWKGQLECLKLIIEAKADVNQKTNTNGNSGLHYACRDGNVECVRLLVDSRASIDLEDNAHQTAFLFAAWKGRLECLQLMIEAKADINHRHKEGFSGIHQACQDGHTECMRLLIESKVDVHAQSEKGQTGLDLASWFGHAECLKLLIDAKADVNGQDMSGSSGLHSACCAGHLECVRLLIDSNADVRLRDEDGETGLWQTAWKGRPDCLKLMIEAKASVDVEDSKGATALDTAIKHSNMDCLFVLLDQPFDAPTKSSALSKAFRLFEDGPSEQAQAAAFTLLAKGADFKASNNVRPPKRRRQAATSRYLNVLGFIDKWHGVTLATLSNLVEVDTRVGRGDYGLYHEPMERVLQYLGLSMTVNQVVNTAVDGESVRRALIPTHARGANQWHELYKRTHCASCNVCPAQKMKMCTCGIVWYCSTVCQRKHWRTHRPEHKRVLKQQEEEREKKYAA